MAATKSQGKAFSLFMVGITATTAGIAYFSTGGKLFLPVGLVVLLASFGIFLKLKPLEGKPALGAQPAVLKLAGLAVVVLGWLVVLFGLHITTGVNGRFATSLIGLAISLVGALYILPVVVNKNAIWKV
jgi:hypothetical protein